VETITRIVHGLTDNDNVQHRKNAIIAALNYWEQAKWLTRESTGTRGRTTNYRLKTPAASTKKPRPTAPETPVESAPKPRCHKAPQQHPKNKVEQQNSPIKLAAAESALKIAGVGKMKRSKLLEGFRELGMEDGEIAKLVDTQSQYMKSKGKYTGALIVELEARIESLREQRNKQHVEGPASVSVSPQEIIDQERAKEKNRSDKLIGSANPEMLEKARTMALDKLSRKTQAQVDDLKTKPIHEWPCVWRRLVADELKAMLQE